MPGVRCHAIQRNKYFVVYPANNYLLKCYGIHDIYIFFHLAEKWIILWDFPLAKMQTYNFPYANHGFLKFSRHTWSDWPCALLIAIEKACRTWNCNRLNSNGMSVGITGRRRMRTSCSFDLPFRTVASMTLSINFLTASQVPLHIRGELMLWRKIMGIPILSDNICCGIPGMSNELKNSIGYFTISSIFMMVSIDL